MARLFIFAIGGTGSRVLKSLVMLLGAGVKARSQREYEIVPIVIDPHKSNDDLKRTIRLLENYQKIVESVGTENGFFATRLTTLDKLSTSDSRLSSAFTFNLQNVVNTKFQEYISFSTLSESSRALVDILFSGKTVDKRGDSIDLLDVEMDIGFVGNPNIGSVVLNQIKDSDEFKEFASNFGSDDRIFIISSIFGGTGAAGFPTILKNIRNADKLQGVSSKKFLKDSKIGAVTVLPYFNIETDDKSPIQKSHFIAKARSALHYYKENITGNKSVNALYYIGDDFTGRPYKNDPGNNGQQNDAHFVEIASALAIFDFLEMGDSELESIDGRAVNPIYKEFGIKNDIDNITLSHLEDPTEDSIGKELAQFTLFYKFIQGQFSSSIGREPWSLQSPSIDNQFTQNSFFRIGIQEFFQSYEQWLKEMSSNRRGFSPFDLDADLVKLIRDKTASSGILNGKLDYPKFNSYLNKVSNGNSFASSQQKLIKLFFEATNLIMKERFGSK